MHTDDDCTTANALRRRGFIFEHAGATRYTWAEVNPLRLFARRIDTPVAASVAE